LKEIGVNLIDNPGLWFDQVTRELILTLKIFLPNLIGGLALLAVGWLTAFFVR